MAHRRMSHQPQLRGAQRHVGLMRQRLGHLHSQSGFADIQRLGMDELILTAQVAPHDRDVMIARAPVVSAEIVSGFHKTDFSSTLDRNEAITIEPPLWYPIDSRTMGPTVTLESGMLIDTAEVLLMDVDAIRSRFIQENLRRALQEPDKERAARAFRAFHNYFQWFEDRLPDFEKMAIRSQLARLERFEREASR